MVKKDGTSSFKGKEYKLRHLPEVLVKVGFIPGHKLLVNKDSLKAAEFLL
jgi:hypothetical protein